MADHKTSVMAGAEHDDRAVLRTLLDAAINAAQATHRISKFLPPRPKGRTLIVGAGKAASQMAKAVEAAWDGPLEGMVVTRYGYATSCATIRVLEAGHPVPDRNGLAAASQMLAVLNGLTEDDLVLALISGGGSALLASPADGLCLNDEIEINRALLASGAPIGVMNLIRNQFSLVKGGRLALACGRAQLVTLVVSDIPSDDPSLVASGPTIPMSGTRAAARELVDLYRIPLPPAARRLLASEVNTPPSPNDDRFTRNLVHTIASASVSLDAAASTARTFGLAPQIFSCSVEGEAKDVGTVHAALVREIALKDRPFTKPVVVLSGGETTVTLRGSGRGGRNTEFLLAFAIAVEGLTGISAIAADTDGIDGSEDNAGAIADGSSALRMRRLGMDPLAALANNNAYEAFAAIGDLVVTGPTGTNVNDFRAVIIR